MSCRHEPSVEELPGAEEMKPAPPAAAGGVGKGDPVGAINRQNSRRFN